jgi:hypothetical protein
MLRQLITVHRHHQPVPYAWALSIWAQSMPSTMHAMNMLRSEGGKMEACTAQILDGLRVGCSQVKAGRIKRSGAGNRRINLRTQVGVGLRRVVFCTWRFFVGPSALCSTFRDESKQLSVSKQATLFRSIKKQRLQTTFTARSACCYQNTTLPIIRKGRQITGARLRFRGYLAIA